jgi:ABC-type multidrug transport system permease subunit
MTTIWILFTIFAILMAISFIATGFTNNNKSWEIFASMFILFFLMLSTIILVGSFFVPKNQRTEFVDCEIYKSPTGKTIAIYDGSIYQTDDAFIYISDNDDIKLRHWYGINMWGQEIELRRYISVQPNKGE